MAWSKIHPMIVTGAILLLAIGTVSVTIEEIEVHRPQVWQKELDMSVLDRVPRQATILPALRSRPKDITDWNEYHGMVLGLNQGVKEIVYVA